MRSSAAVAGLPDFTRIVGIGHSLGGSLVVVQQAQHGSYDAVVALGSTQSPKAAVDDSMGRAGDSWLEVADAQATQFLGSDAPYGYPAKKGSESWLYGPNDDPVVTAEDVEISVEWPRAPYVEALGPGLTERFAREF